MVVMLLLIAALGAPALSAAHSSVGKALTVELLALRPFACASLNWYVG